MAKWEYLVRVFALDKDDEVVIDYIQRDYPDRDWKELPNYDPLTLEAWLSQCGREGWELVSMVPAQAQGKQGDVGLVFTAANNWVRYYLCVFKRSSAS